MHKSSIAVDTFILHFDEGGGAHTGLTFPEAKDRALAYGTRTHITNLAGIEWWNSECPGCQHTGMYPSHHGSRNCESGALAAGGTVAHCTCDACW